MAIAARVNAQALVRTTESSALLPRRKRADAPGGTKMLFDDDFFSTTMPWAMLLVTALPFAGLFLWQVAAYFGVEYGTPPWNTHSVPPPRIY